MIKNIIIVVLAGIVAVGSVGLYKTNCTEKKIMAALESSKIDFHFSEPDSFKDTLTIMIENDPKNYKPHYYQARDLYLTAIKDFQNDIDNYNEKFALQPDEIKFENGKVSRIKPAPKQLSMAEHMMQNAFLIKQGQRIGQMLAAKEHLSTSLQLNPAFIEGYILLGRINSRLGLFGLAYENFNKAYELGGKKDEDLLFLVSNMEKRKEFEKENRPLDMEYLSLGEAEEMSLSSTR